MPADPDAIVYAVRELATAARAAAKVWRPFIDEDGNPDPPDSAREVLVFLNGHVDLLDDEGRNGGGWGIRLGFFDDGVWRVHGRVERHVSHWLDLPPPPPREVPDAD